MTDEEFERLRADIEELREETRRTLAEDLGGDPEDAASDPSSPLTATNSLRHSCDPFVPYLDR